MRASNDICYLRNFVDACSFTDPGVEFDLVILMKGFVEGVADERHRALLSRPAVGRLRWHYVTDDGFDINAYWNVAEALRSDYELVCFLNSYATPTADGWLAMLVEACAGGDGVSAATGSWLSFRGSNGDDELLAEKARRINELTSMGDSEQDDTTRQRIRDVEVAADFLHRFPVFPNPHVRTNAFVMKVSEFLGAARFDIRSKSDAYAYESGAAGLSAQLLRAGKSLTVVGRDGRRYSVPEWQESQTFWSGSQDNVLVSDNMTRMFLNADHSKRVELSSLAWKGQGPSSSAEAAFEYQLTLLRQDRFVQRKRDALRAADRKSDGAPNRVVIYGAGVLGEGFDGWIRANLRNTVVVAFVDGNPGQNANGRSNIHSPTYLKDGRNDFDTLLLASFASEAALRMRALDSGIEDKRII